MTQNAHSKNSFSNKSNSTFVNVITVRLNTVSALCQQSFTAFQVFCFCKKHVYSSFPHHIRATYEFQGPLISSKIYTKSKQSKQKLETTDWDGPFYCHSLPIDFCFQWILFHFKKIKKIKVCYCWSLQNISYVQSHLFSICQPWGLQGYKEYKNLTSGPVYNQVDLAKSDPGGPSATAGFSKMLHCTRQPTNTVVSTSNKVAKKKEENFTSQHLLPRPNHQPAPVASRALMDTDQLHP